MFISGIKKNRVLISNNLIKYNKIKFVKFSTNNQKISTNNQKNLTNCLKFTPEVIPIFVYLFGIITCTGLGLSNQYIAVQEIKLDKNGNKLSKLDKNMKTFSYCLDGIFSGFIIGLVWPIAIPLGIINYYHNK